MNDTRTVADVIREWREANVQPTDWKDLESRIIYYITGLGPIRPQEQASQPSTEAELEDFEYDMEPCVCDHYRREHHYRTDHCTYPGCGCTKFDLLHEVVGKDCICNPRKPNLYCPVHAKKEKR